MPKEVITPVVDGWGYSLSWLDDHYLATLFHVERMHGRFAILSHDAAGYWKVRVKDSRGKQHQVLLTGNDMAIIEAIRRDIARRETATKRDT